MNADFPNIRRSTRWGQTYARQWQNLVQTTEQLSRLTVGKGLRKRQSGANLIIEQVPVKVGRQQRARVQAVGFRVIEIGDDWLRCHTWNGETEGDTPIHVAKPWLLRRTPFDGPWGTSKRTPFWYEYTRHWERRAFDAEADDPFEYELQVIVPKYVPQTEPPEEPSEEWLPEYVGDLIVAVQSKTDVIVGDRPVDWLDLNIDGRAWARKWTQGVEE